MPNQMIALPALLTTFAGGEKVQICRWQISKKSVKLHSRFILKTRRLVNITPGVKHKELVSNCLAPEARSLSWRRRRLSGLGNMAGAGGAPRPEARIMYG